MKVSFMKKEISSLQGNMSVPYAESKRPSSVGRRVFTWAFVLLPVLLFLISVAIDSWRIRTDAMIVQSHQTITAAMDCVVDSVYIEDSTVVLEKSTLFVLRRGHETPFVPVAISPAMERERSVLDQLNRRRIALARKEIRDANEYLSAVDRMFQEKAATFGELSEARKRLFWAKDHLEALLEINSNSEMEKASFKVSSSAGIQTILDTITTKETVFIDSLLVKKGSVVFRGQKLASIRLEPAQWEVEISCKPSQLPYLARGKKGYLILPDRSKIGIEITAKPPVAAVDTTESGLITGSRDIIKFTAKVTEPLPDWVLVNQLKVHVQFLRKKLI